MITRDAGGDVAAALLERRWFASITAVRAMQAECEMLREVLDLAEDAWRRARSQLVRLEALRDALGDELSRRDEQHVENALVDTDRRVSSAA